MGRRVRRVLDDDAGFGEPTEDEYDPYGEGYTLDDSPYYDPDREDEDEGEAEVTEKTVQPWRHTDKMTDFWEWMKENHPKVPNPNTRGTKKEISPSTLKGYARGGAGYSARARETIGRDLVRFQEEGKRDVQASRVAAAWLRKTAKATFEEWVEGRRFRNPATGNLILFKSLKQPEQERIRGQWGNQERF